MATWKTCERFPNFEVSDTGKVRRGKTKRIVGTRYNQRNGYAYVVLWNKEQQKTTTVALAPLIAVAFLGPRPDGHQINHKDGNKRNNKAKNLEYVTQSENVLHAYANNLISKERCDYTVTTLKDHMRIFELHKQGYSQVKIGEMVGRTNSCISRILNGKSHLRHGEFYERWGPGGLTDFLHQAYVVEKKSVRKIARLLGVCYSTVRKAMKRRNMTIRETDE